jgi:hypothetical protein
MKSMHTNKVTAMMRIAIFECNNVNSLTFLFEDKSDAPGVSTRFAITGYPPQWVPPWFQEVEE